ncbi:MAG: hypothetical protein QGG42_13880 [Phycisphaerae bacterium]|jgi:hypothetical protein|nr:hypothetical protein [Phycisphaerae bacterium]
MKTRDIISLTAYGVLGFGFVLTAGIQFYVAQPWTQPRAAASWFLFLWVLCWSILPYGMLMNHVRCFRKQNARVSGVLLLLVAGTAIAAFGVWAYLDAFFIARRCGWGRDAFINIPLLQNLAALIGIALANGVNLGSKQLEKPESDQKPSSPDCGMAEGGLHSIHVVDDLSAVSNETDQSGAAEKLGEQISWRQIRKEAVWMGLLMSPLTCMFVLMFIAGSMEEFILYWVPTITLVIWLLLMIAYVRKPRPPKRKFIWVSLRNAFAAGSLAVTFVCVYGLSIPGYVRKTEQFCAEMKSKVDIPAIRTWMESYHRSSEINAETEERESWIIHLDDKKLPECISVLGSSDVTYDVKKEYLELTYGGGFDHWGLTIGPKGSKPPGGYVKMVEDGVWVWHEIR